MDIIGISETWLHELIPDSLININDYQVFRNDHIRKKGGGTCLYLRNSMKVAIEKEPLSTRDLELQECTILGNEGFQKQIIVIIAYRPPHGSSLKACDELKRYVTSIPGYDKKELVIMGDLNWNFSDKKCPAFKWINNITTEFDTVQHIKTPTRITLGSNSIIDLMMSNLNNVYKSGCIDFMISHHHPTYLIKKKGTLSK